MTGETRVIHLMDLSEAAWIDALGRSLHIRAKLLSVPGHAALWEGGEKRMRSASSIMDPIPRVSSPYASLRSLIGHSFVPQTSNFPTFPSTPAGATDLLVGLQGVFIFTQEFTLDNCFPSIIDLVNVMYGRYVGVKKRACLGNDFEFRTERQGGYLTAVARAIWMNPLG